MKWRMTRKAYKTSKRLAVQERPASNWPAIFYAPHEDDETLAMAGGIREHVLAGRPVYIVVITGNKWMDPSWPSENYADYDPPPTIEQVRRSRQLEFEGSLRRLGVRLDHVYYEDLQEGTVTEHQMCKIIVKYETLHPGASHKLVSGVLVSGVLEQSEPSNYNPTHIACWNAAKYLPEYIKDLRFYRVYEFYKPEAERTANYYIANICGYMCTKRAALDEYMFDNAAQGRFAVGKHSVPDLFAATKKDAHEYIDMWTP